MNDKEYNGWSNWHTWNTVNWLSGSSQAISNEAFRIAPAQRQSEFTEWSINRLTFMCPDEGIDFDKVNWREVHQAFQEGEQ
jgi:hypothetical protein